MKQYAVAVVSFSVIFYLTLVAVNMVMVSALPAGTGNDWEAAAQHSGQIVVQDGVSILPIIISAVIAFGAGCFIFKKFSERMR